MLSLSHYLILSAVLFSIAMAGIFLNRKNLIVLLMSVELMLLSVNINFIAFSHYLNDIAGQMFVFFILAVAAAEAAIGLAILVVLFRNTREAIGGFPERRCLPQALPSGRPVPDTADGWGKPGPPGRRPEGEMRGKEGDTMARTSWPTRAHRTRKRQPTGSVPTMTAA